MNDTLTPGNHTMVDGEGSTPAFKKLSKYYADRYFIRDMAGLE